MLEFYPQIRLVHICAVSASAAWFALRFAALLAGMRWPRWIAARALGWTIDAALLTAATMLWTSLPGALFANGWLHVKLMFVALYLGASWTALQPRRGRKRFIALSLLALTSWGSAYGIARMHSPLG